MQFDFTLWALVGALGIWCIEASYVPQIVRLWRLKEAEDISLLFPGLNVLGRLLAFCYALHLGEGVFVVGFMVGIVLRSTLLGQVLWYRWGKHMWRSPARNPDSSLALKVSG